jgi:hypothetical protein
VETNYRYLQDGCFEIEPDGTKTKLHADRFTRPTELQNKPTRAQRMAEQYGAKLDQINGTKIAHEPRKIMHDETETLEMRTKRKVALEKLATFRDLLG